uniref:Uncharacterized protein n=2 Tax=Brassica oleracea TaxID=3712 RepID=A0A0D3B438_BRAOL|nr:unnamed protein product [Brassica oleracea]
MGFLELRSILSYDASEVVPRGSTQSCPSSPEFDSSVDDLASPKKKSKEIEIAMDAISVVKLCFVCDLSVNQEQMMYEETLALDARFGDSKLNLVSPSLSPLIPSPSRVKGGGCGRVKFGIKSAAVRVEGFDCLDRDRQNSSIPAMA